jgi:hydroxyacylglutathione hydrolase
MSITVIPIGLGIVSAFLVRDRKDILIDTGGPGAGARLLRRLESLGIDPAALTLLLVTHGHLDHFGGARDIMSSLTCPLAVHALDAEAVRLGWNTSGEPADGMTRVLMGASRPVPGRRAHPVEPGLVFRGSLDLKPYGVDAVVEHTPGHTPGSVTVFLGNGEAIVGDLLRGSLRAPREPRWPFVLQSWSELRRSIGRVLDRRPRKLWTSHAGPLEPDAVRALLRRSSPD